MEENKKPVLYLVSSVYHCLTDAPTQTCCILLKARRLTKLVLQVFEYLSTDLKKFMDRKGKGPNFPLDPMLIKVPCSEPNASALCDDVQANISQYRQPQCWMPRSTSSV